MIFVIVSTMIQKLFDLKCKLQFLPSSGLLTRTSGMIN